MEDGRGYMDEAYEADTPKKGRETVIYLEEYIAGS